MIWKFISWIITRRAIFRWLQRRGWRTPYTHIGPEGNEYMMRFWLFNPYGKDEKGSVTPPRRPRLPSIRLHWIKRPDQDRHLHTHPWKMARTIVLDGWYDEERYVEPGQSCPLWRSRVDSEGRVRRTDLRPAGYSGTLNHEMCHRISAVPPDGVWTLFITWGPSLGWGFSVEGKIVPWRQYLNLKP